MTATKRAGQVTGLALVLALALLAWQSLGPPGPAPVLTAGEVLLDAYDRSAAACVSEAEIMRAVTAAAMRWSEVAPVNCTDAPPDTRWIRVTVEDRVRHYAFGPDGCRIAVSQVPCP
jgi:hypothetical protein